MLISMLRVHVKSESIFARSIGTQRVNSRATIDVVVTRSTLEEIRPRVRV